jgi:hypothetical protein
MEERRGNEPTPSMKRIGVCIVVQCKNLRICDFLRAVCAIFPCRFSKFFSHSNLQIANKGSVRRPSCRLRTIAAAGGTVGRRSFAAGGRRVTFAGPAP